MTETPKPLYKPLKPSYLNILTTQSVNPLNSLSAFPLATSTPKRVLAKSNQ